MNSESPAGCVSTCSVAILGESDVLFMFREMAIAHAQTLEILSLQSPGNDPNLDPAKTHRIVQRFPRPVDLNRAQACLNVRLALIRPFFLGKDSSRLDSVLSTIDFGDYRDLDFLLCLEEIRSSALSLIAPEPFEFKGCTAKKAHGARPCHGHQHDIHPAWLASLILYGGILHSDLDKFDKSHTSEAYAQVLEVETWLRSAEQAVQLAAELLVHHGGALGIKPRRVAGRPAHEIEAWLEKKNGSRPLTPATLESRIDPKDPRP